MGKKKKEFTMERYNQIKELLGGVGIESYELESYVMAKDLKYLRHTQRISLTDAEIIEMINDANSKSKFEELLGIVREKEVDKEN
jgi:hypothetical protein